MRLLVRDCPTYLQNVLLDVLGAPLLQAAIHAGRSIPLAALTVTTIKDHPDVRIVGERRLKPLVTLALTARQPIASGERLVVVTAWRHHLCQVARGRSA